MRVRAARGKGKVRLSLKDLAAATGVPRSSLANYLTGATLMPGDVLDAVVQALGADPPEARRWARDWESACDRHLRDALPRPLHAPMPDGPEHFTGRARALAALDQVGRVCLIVGTAGVGKTALALHWARRAADRFPDGMVFLSLDGQSEPVSPVLALERLLRALGVDAIPPDLPDRTARYRECIAHRRCLIVLDDAVSADQVRPLLPGSGAATVLVTSRDSLGGLVARDQAHRVVLERLSEGEAGELLERLVGTERMGAEHAAWTGLIHHCAGLPLVLRLVAERMAHRPQLTPAMLLAELGDAALDVLSRDGDQLASVRAVFSTSYQALSTSAGRLFRLLGLCPGADLDVHAAANLAAATLLDTRAALDELYQAHLIEETRPGGYAMHDLLRAFAAERVIAEVALTERKAALIRLIDWYVHQAENAADLFDPHEPKPPLPPVSPAVPGPGFADAAEALAWLEAERANLTAAVRWGAAETEYGQIWRLPQALWQFFHLRGHLDDWIETHRVALTATDDRLGTAITFTHLSIAHAWRGEIPATLHCRRLALDGFRKTGYPHGEAVALFLLGEMSLLTGDYGDGLRHLTQALQVAKDSANWRAEFIARVGLAQVLTRLGRLEEALAEERCLLRLAAETGTVRGAALAENAFGDTWLARGDWESAARHFRRALTAGREVADLRSEIIALSGLGIAASRTGAHQDAVALHQQALLLTERLFGPGLACRVLNDLAETYVAAGDPEAADECRDQALTLATRAGDTHEHARATTR